MISLRLTKMPKWYYQDIHIADSQVIKEVPGKTVSVTQKSDKNIYSRHVLNVSIMETDAHGVLRMQITIDWNVHEFIIDGRIPKRVKFIDLLRTPEDRKARTYLVSAWQCAGGGWRHMYQRGLDHSPEDNPDLNAE